MRSPGPSRSSARVRCAERRAASWGVGTGRRALGRPRPRCCKTRLPSRCRLTLRTGASLTPRQRGPPLVSRREASCGSLLALWSEQEDFGSPDTPHFPSPPQPEPLGPGLGWHISRPAPATPGFSADPCLTLGGGHCGSLLPQIHIPSLSLLSPLLGSFTCRDPLCNRPGWGAG